MIKKQIWKAKISNFPSADVKLPITGQGNDLYWDSSPDAKYYMYIPFKHDWDAVSFSIKEGNKKSYKTMREMIYQIGSSKYSGEKNLQEKATDNRYIVTTKNDFNCFLVIKHNNLYYLPDNQILDPLRIENIYQLKNLNEGRLQQLLNSLNEKRKATKLVQSY